MKKVLLFLNLIVIVLLSIFWIFVAVPFLFVVWAFASLDSDGKFIIPYHPIRAMFVNFIFLLIFLLITISIIKSFQFNIQLFNKTDITRKDILKLLIYLLIDTLPVLCSILMYIYDI